MCFRHSPSRQATIARLPAIRYVHGFCLMLPPDGPFLEPALALLALPFRPVTAGDFTSSLSARRSASASCQAHIRVGSGLSDHPLPTERLVPAR